MKEHYYYLRREKQKTVDGEIISNGLHRCGVVYLVSSENGEIARGVSLCKSSEDPFMRDPGYLKEKSGKIKPFVGGVKLAKKRAMKAFNSKNDSEPIIDATALSKVSALGIQSKSEYLPPLTDFEKKIIGDKEAQ